MRHNQMMDDMSCKTVFATVRYHLLREKGQIAARWARTTNH